METHKLTMVNVVRLGRRETKFIMVPVDPDGKVRVDLGKLFDLKPSDGCVGFSR
jgi:hypothetical protein